MKLFLDTAKVSDIRAWLDTGLIDGVTTNPTHLAHEGGDPLKTVQTICGLLPEGEISVEVTATKPDEVYKQAKEIASLANTILVKIPCHVQYYPVIKKLVQEGVRLNITLVFTLLQGLMMSKLGVTYISPFVGRWDDLDVEGVTLLVDMRAMIDEYGFSTMVLAASLRHVRHVHYAIVAGVDAITVPVAVLEQSVKHPLTDKGIELFNADWQKLGIKQFP